MLLFIGQVPFLQKMEEKMNSEVPAGKMSCCKEEKADNVCHQPEKKKSESKEDACCKTEARGACVCCYSIAPVTERSGLQKFFGDAAAVKIITGNTALAFQSYPVLTPPPDVL